MCMTELMKSIKILFTNLIWRDLVRKRKVSEVLHHGSASIKLYMLTFFFLITRVVHSHKKQIVWKHWPS